MQTRGSLAVERLDNGVLVVIDRYASSLASLVVGIGVGPLFEESDEKGYSHLMEHMLFNVSGFDVDRAVESLGAETNAYTHRLQVVLTFQSLAESAGGLAEIAARMLTNRRYDEDRFEKEKRVVLSEIRMSKEDPSERIGDLGLLSLFGETDWGLPIDGDPHVISTAELRDLEEFMEKWIAPNNIIVAAAGGFSLEEVERVKAEFSKLSSPSQHKTVPPMGRGKLFAEEVRDDIDGVYYSYAAKLTLDNAYIRLSAAAFHLASGTKSILFDELRNRGLAYSYYVDFDAVGGDGFIQIVVESAHELEAVREVVRRILRTKWVPPQHRLKYFEYEWRKTMEIPLNRAYAYVEAIARGIEPESLGQVMSKAVQEGLARIPDAVEYEAEAVLRKPD
ncbi:M16 family metallopeptidase [Thermoproteus tenax]|uniref:Family M16 protease n=1 Tax=Thermoproteus tenax (strain ATCC 35583 / DSM 2078 / JCM 9277 / NBRC 100435 / Kra 1) TaxID=768679 RepID=G4RM43_THETK|nr:pitrilysin family protein [Thermoproteus tenax]CCC82638.1 family M16 protease [Thermoproteus tenax Kra 1]